VVRNGMVKEVVDFRGCHSNSFVAIGGALYYCRRAQLLVVGEVKLWLLRRGSVITADPCTFEILAATASTSVHTIVAPLTSPQSTLSLQRIMANPAKKAGGATDRPSPPNQT
jgi:hypothetical protein